jgi:TonB family protein
VLLHELAHVRRGDTATHFMARLTLCLYWWNPLAWKAWHEFLKERERAADDLVLTAGARPPEYADNLLQIARSMQSPAATGWAAVAMARPSQLEGRLLAILDQGRSRQAPRRASAVAAILLAVGIAAPLAALQSQADDVPALPADVDAMISVAVSQRNHAMLENAAEAAEALRKYDLARTLLESALAIRAGSSGKGSADYAVGLLKLGQLERNRGRFFEAEAYYAEALPALGNRPEAAPALIYLGIAALGKKDVEQAIGYFQQAQAAGPADAGPAMMWMAVARERQQNTDEAESLYRGALAVQDPNSAGAATTLELYTWFLRRQGREDDAKSMQERAAALRTAQSRQTQPEGRTTGPVYRIGNGVTPPMLLSKVEPVYTEEARIARYQGTVVVYAEVGQDGMARNLRIIRGLGLGLNEKAIEAISQWKFEPGVRDGRPVVVAATIEVNWRLL